jgi:hypothetical protein
LLGLAKSPFTPSFGTTPPVLAGRDELIAQFAEGLDDGPGAAARATLYAGARGTGKTVLLNAAEEQARSRGWLVISETATPGFIERLASDHLPRVLASVDPEAVKRRLTSIQAPLNLGGVGWATDEQHRPRPSLRSQIELLTDLLAENETGLLITLDEIHHHQKSELREFGAIVQHAFREARELAFVAAALPAAVNDLLNDSVLTFLRRADHHHLERVEEDAVREALRKPILNAGRSLTPPALETMVAATQGYPFLIQLVGDQVWRKATNEGEIDLPSAHAGVYAARRRLGQLVHAPALAEAQTSTSRSCWQCPPTTAPRRCATSKHASEWTRTTRASTGCVCSRWSLSHRLAAAVSTSRCPTYATTCASTPPRSA